jgi:muramoyltetrapeptide carboxypeptidase
VKIPIVCGLPFGHIRDKATLAVGALARLETDARRLRLGMRGYPFLSQ